MNKEANEKINGIVQSIIFANEDTGYKVLELEDGAGDLVTAVGTLPGVSEGECLEAVGYWDEHSVYGEQFKICSFSRTLPTDAEAMKRYLASGAVKGVGIALASRIVNYFGDDTFFVMENHPERLAEVKGIGPAAACSIGEQFAAGREMRETMMFLAEYGISTAYAVSIYNAFGSHTSEVIRRNPYILAERIRGIGFTKADEIARKMGIPEDSPERVKACVRHVLQEAAALEGHCYLPFSELENRVFEAIGSEGLEVENAVTELSLSGKVRAVAGDDSHVYLPNYYRAEFSSASYLCTLAKAKRESRISDADIASAEKKQNILLSEEQKDALKMALTEGVVVINGGPGTGKTTIINTLLALLDKQKESYLMAAPTGRAAKRMAELTGKPASTLHRLLEVKVNGDLDGGDDHFARNEENPLETQCVIVDELSMVDISLFYALLRAIAPGTRLVLVGDSDQLPSVGAGNVLRDILDSGVVPVARLTEIYRQAKISDIVVNAHRVNHGEYPVFNQKDTDFFLVRQSNAREAQKVLVDLVKNRMPKFAKVSPMDIQVMSPQHMGDLGVDALNPVLQATLNPPCKGKAELAFREIVFREGDRVMQLKNNYEMEWVVKNEYGIEKDNGAGVFNGDMGRIVKVNLADKTLTVLFDEVKEVEYSYMNLEELSLCYAVTIHKSQGSQSPVVILPLLTGPAPLYQRNLLYTAITRAQRYVVVVGSEDTVRRMVDNNLGRARFTSLCSALQKMNQ